MLDAHGQPTVDEAGHPQVETVRLSDAARRVPAEAFAGVLLPEAHRRGLDRAGLVLSLTDGADWIETQRTRLQTEATPAGFLADLMTAAAPGPHRAAPSGPDGLTPAAWLTREVAYFTKRAEQIQCHAFRQAGYPIGSGRAESGHQVVIGERFKGADQHWAPPHLNPLVQLRVVEANGRWRETWPPIAAQQRAAMHARQATTRARRQAQRAPAATPPAPPPVALPPPAPVPVLAPVAPSIAPAGPRRPAAHHPGAVAARPRANAGLVDRPKLCRSPSRPVAQSRSSAAPPASLVAAFATIPDPRRSEWTRFPLPAVLASSVGEVAPVA